MIEQEKEKLGLERTEINSELSKLNPNNSKDQQRINQSNSRLAEIENLTNMANDDIQDYEVLINEADRVIQLESDAQRNQDFMNNLNQGRDKTNYVNPNIPPNDR